MSGSMPMTTAAWKGTHKDSTSSQIKISHNSVLFCLMTKYNCLDCKIIFTVAKLFWTFYSLRLGIQACWHQINFLYWLSFLVSLGSHLYHFSKQFFFNLIKINDKSLPCFHSCKMVILTTNIVLKNFTQYRKFICFAYGFLTPRRFLTLGGLPFHTVQAFSWGLTFYSNRF